mgnify:CR=1 FL=1
MFKIKATEGVNILIADLGLVVTGNFEQIISNEDYERSSDLQKVKNFLIIKQFEENNEVIEDSISTEDKKEKTSFVKEIEDLEDNPKVVEEKKEKIFVAKYNEPEINLNDENEEIKHSSDFKQVVEDTATPIVREAENGKIVNANNSFVTDVNKEEVKADKKTRKTSTKKTAGESSEKKTKSPKKAKVVKTEENQVVEKQIEAEKLEK